MPEDIEIYTDGGCHGNPGPGGWAFVYSDGGKTEEQRGFEQKTTNNRMELTAVIKALELVEDKGRCGRANISIYTDSQYVQKGISEWIHGWLKNNWKTAAKKPVKNKDLWVQLHELSSRCSPSWNWVRGHTGNEKNERCDQLVQEAIKSAEN